MKAQNPIGLNRLILVVLLPLVAFVLQSIFWAAIKPFAWFLFFPAVFFSSWIGGLSGAVIATFISTALAWWAFIPPEHSFALEDPSQIASIGLFMVMGVLFGYSHERIKKANRETREALAAVRSANDQLETRVRERTAELAQINESLQTSEARMAGIVDSAIDAIISVDSEQKIVLFNAGAEEIFRCPAGKAIGQPIDMFIPQRFREQHRQHVQGFGKTGVASRSMRSRGPLSGLRAEGEEFPIEASISQIEVAGQKLFTVILRDITERKLAEEKLKKAMEELERSNKELEQFAYVASHDLQEPLRMVSSFTQLLARRYKDKLDADADDFIAYAVDGANRMQRLISDLLMYSRVGTRGRPFEPCDLHSILGEVLVNLQPTIGESHAIITNDGLPAVMADPTQLVQLFQNLISNAVRFRGDDAPRIHISVQEKPAEWLFSVRDNGIGIAPEYRERIFAIFQRLHPQSHAQGTGIGLAICKRIVERHGGKLWVESEPGRGSTFYFTISKGKGEQRL